MGKSRGEFKPGTEVWKCQERVKWAWEPGHWDRNVHDKIKACCLRASPLFHLSSCGEFSRLEDLTSQGRRMGAGVWGPTFLLVTLQEAGLKASHVPLLSSPSAVPPPPTSCPGDAKSHLYLAPEVWEHCL